MTQKRLQREADHKAFLARTTTLADMKPVYEEAQRQRGQAKQKYQEAIEAEIQRHTNPALRG